MAFITASSQTAGLDEQNVKMKYQESLEGLGEQLLSFIWKSFHVYVSAFECYFFKSA